jgi:hypothetical protein
MASALVRIQCGRIAVPGDERVLAVHPFGATALGAGIYFAVPLDVWIATGRVQEQGRTCWRSRCG